MSSLSQAASSVEKRTNARYWIVVMLFIVTSFNYGDRATLSIAGSEMAKDIGLDPVGMGYVFSAFSWAYVIGQIPGGWLLDRFGSKRVFRPRFLRRTYALFGSGPVNKNTPRVAVRRRNFLHFTLRNVVHTVKANQRIAGIKRFWIKLRRIIQLFVAIALSLT